MICTQSVLWWLLYKVYIDTIDNIALLVSTGINNTTITRDTDKIGWKAEKNLYWLDKTEIVEQCNIYKSSLDNKHTADNKWYWEEKQSRLCRWWYKLLNYWVVLWFWYSTELKTLGFSAFYREDVKSPMRNTLTQKKVIISIEHELEHEGEREYEHYYTQKSQLIFPQPCYPTTQAFSRSNSNPFNFFPNLSLKKSRACDQHELFCPLLFQLARNPELKSVQKRKLW